jgi:hypothetical protein
MQTVHVQSQTGSDGILHLEIPVGLPNADVDVVLVIQPRGLAPSPEAADEAPGWPPGFFEETAGAWQGALVRDQGQFEEREGL